MNDLAKVTLISGKAIASTLKTVSTLGEIGKKILDSAGIQEIDLEGWYPSNLRIQMFDETFERFGSEALFVFGIKQLDEDQNGTVSSATGKSNLFVKSNILDGFKT